MNRSWGALSLALLCAAPIALSGCSDPKHAVKVNPSKALVRDVPRPLLGTIGAEAAFRGVDPTLISGLGIVVGLAGTGGSDNLDPAVQTTMERELARGGVSSGGPIQNYPGFEGMTPAQFLRSPDVAVVIVEARVPPGAPEGTPFDVFVRKLPGSSVTSLEGGRLWTTEMRIGPAAVFGAVKTRKIGEARGPIFINPFSEPSVAANGEVQITRTSGRILGGGKVTSPLQIEMVLDNDSFARARSVVGTINSRFPREPGDEGPIARGRGNGGGTAGYQSIALRVPYAYRERSDEFLQLVRHMRVDPSLPEEWARSYVEALKTTPALAEDLRWCLQAIGRPALPFLSQLYDYSETGPRMAALKAGARLGDPRAAPPLIELAHKGTPAIQVEALRLLADMPSDPRVNLAMRELVDDTNLEVRIAAYEGLLKRNDQTVFSVRIGTDSLQPKFMLDLVPAKDPTIYITQQGEPRIVLFGPIEKGRGIPINKPILLSLWDDRFMLSAPGVTDTLRVYYRDSFTGKVTQSDAPENLADFVQFIAHKSTPEDPKPGLGLSYSQTVGVLYAMCPRMTPGPDAAQAALASAVSATFATEEDRLRAEIYEAMQTTMLSDRPETEAEALKQSDAVFKPTAPAALPSAAPQDGGDMKSKIIPLKQPSKDGKTAARP
jgi:hypothetical protein